MSLSASDIRNRSFSQGLRGLDSDEVYAFLDQVADRWDEMTRRTQTLEERVQTLESKLDKIGDTADKAQTAKKRAEELQEKMRAKKQRLEENERELDEERDRLETKQAKLRAIVQRVQETLQEETDALSSLVSGDGAAAGSGDTAEASGAEGSGTEDDKSSEEWVDSLFPNRLPESEPTAASENDDDATTEAGDENDLSASESQFEAIKQDVQGMKQETPRPSAASGEEDEEGSPPTEEMNQIWDVFDEQE